MAGNTPIYGFPYPEPTDLVADYPALGQQLAEDIEDVLPTIGGLAPATPTSIANSGGSASLTGNTVTFSGVSSVSLNGCFTGDYDNYRVLVSVTNGSTADTYMRFRSAGTDATGNNYAYRQFVIGSSTAIYAGTGTLFGISSGATTACKSSFDLFDPSAATYSRAILSAVSNGVTGLYITASEHQLNTSYDGLTIYPSTGTMTGTVSVYGYRR